ncbi:MAG: TonB-dependent receptor, partial [Bacteroidetes bacterium]|nr:TonB-dependent receptor [Bacteroidota bacterium]
MRRWIPLLALLSVLASMAWATGKIRGRVQDRDSREPLVGANVLVVGTAMGSATDVNGEFTILEIAAGTYTLRATYVGYSALSVSNIRVNNTLTTDVTLELVSESVTLQAVEVVAERPLVTRDATNAVRITTAEDISSLPVRGVNNILALQAGVVLKDNQIFVRGGRQDEVGFYLEGVSITNPMVGGAAV